MQSLRPRFLFPFFTALVAVSLATLVLVSFWLTGSPLADLSLTAAGLALTLGCALFLATRFPIHVRHNLKLIVMTLPLFLMAALLSPPLAAVTAGASILAFQLDARKRMGLLPTDIATSVGRWIVTVGVGSAIAHQQFAFDSTGAFALVLAAIFMFCGDMLGSAFEISAMTRELPWQLVRVLVREMAFPESIQYAIGILAVLVARTQWITLPFFFLPLIGVYILFKHLKEMQEGTRLMLQDMADAVDLRDPYTGGHSRRVAELCQAILSQMNLNGPETDLIVVAARVHDIGKVGVPEELLVKPGQLTPAERLVMETHVTIGADLLRRYPNFSRGREIVLHHHETWNGEGYPSRLKGLNIPLGARVIAVADAFDALTTDRPYRRAFTVEQALTVLQQGRGTQWDPDIIDTFLATRSSPVPASAHPSHSVPVQVQPTAS